MKIKITAFCVAALAVLLGLVWNASKAEPPSPQDVKAQMEEKERSVGLTLRERVRLAKLEGRQKISVPASFSSRHYAGFSNFDTAAAVYTAVIAEPVAAVSYVGSDGLIVTSYKFKTGEVLSEPGSSNYPSTFNGDIRPELLPLEKGEFIVSVLGGTATVDGVEVTVKYDDYEPISLSRRYLMLLDFDTTKRVGGMDMGPLSVLAINDDGTLETLDGGRHKIKKEVDARFGNSVERLKAHLKKRGG